MLERRCRAEQSPRLNGERDLTASLNIPGGAIAAANDGVNAFNRAYHSSFFYIRFVLLLPLRRNSARYLLLRNLKLLEKKGDEFSLCAGFSFHDVSSRDL